VPGRSRTPTWRVCAGPLRWREISVNRKPVDAGHAASRSDAVRRGIARLRRDQRYREDEAILLELAGRGEAVYPDLEGLADLRHPQLD
jgi:hypothetical protein